MAERPPALSAEALAALAVYRDTTVMPEQARERVHARLSEAGATRPAWLWVGVGAVAAGLLLWGAFGVSDALRMTPDAPGSQAPMQAPQGPGETAALVPPKPPEPAARRPAVLKPPTPTGPVPFEEPEEPEEVEAPVAPALPAAAPPRPPSRRKARSAPPTPPEPSPPPLPASRLGVENRLIARTWEQVRTKQYAKARQTLAEHASEFPSGVLAPERRALIVIVACLQHPESAAGKADAYAAKGRSTLLAKVRSACNEEKQAPK